MVVINEENVPKEQVSQRYLQWLISKNGVISSEDCACCIVTLPPKHSAAPPHSHLDCEEAIFILEGEGEMIIQNGVCEQVKPGSLILMRKETPHMLCNTSEISMKAICFYSAATDIKQYKFFTESEFGLK